MSYVAYGGLTGLETVPWPRGEAPAALGTKQTCPRCGAGLGPCTTDRREGSNTQPQGPDSAGQSGPSCNMVEKTSLKLEKLSETHHVPQKISFGLQALMGPFQVRHHGGRSTLPDGLLATKNKYWEQLKYIMVSLLSKCLLPHTVIKSPQTVSDNAELWQCVHSFQKKENIVYLYKLAKYLHPHISNAGVNISIDQNLF